MNFTDYLVFNVYENEKSAFYQSENLRKQGYLTRILEIKNGFRLDYKAPKKTYRVTKPKSEPIEPTEEEIKLLEEE